MIGNAIPFYGETILNNFYGVKIEVDPNREAKVKEVIASMGDKWVFAKRVEKKSND